MLCEKLSEVSTVKYEVTTTMVEATSKIPCHQGGLLLKSACITSDRVFKATSTIEATSTVKVTPTAKVAATVSLDDGLPS